MRLRFVMALLAALALCVGGLSAQVPSGTNASGGSQKNTGKPAKKGDMPVKVIGCLSGAEKNGIILTAEPGDLSAGVATQTQGTVPSVTYQLVGGDRAKLAGLIGQRVEVEGTTTRKPAAKEKVQSREQSSAKGTSGKTPTVETSEKSNIEVRKLNVTSVRQTAGECPAAK